MTGYEQKIGLLRQSLGKRGGTAIQRIVLAAAVLALVALALLFGVLEYRHKEPAIPVPTPTCCALPMPSPEPPHQPP